MAASCCKGLPEEGEQVGGSRRGADTRRKGGGKGWQSAGDEGTDERGLLLETVADVEE